MLNNTFFTILSQTGDTDSFSFQVELDENHPVFKGHFPQQPVVPGVFTLQIIKECVETVLGKAMQYTEIKNCKFSRLITPAENKQLEISGTIKPTDDSGKIQLNAQVKKDDNTFLSLKACLIALSKDK